MTPLENCSWEPYRIKHLFTERNEKGFAGAEPLAATQHAGVVPKSTLAFRTMEVISGEPSAQKLVQPGDFVISLRSFEGGLEYSAYGGILSPAYTVLMPGANVFPPFFKHALKSEQFVQSLSKHKKGIRDGQAVPFDSLQDDYFLVPPIKEQERIANFLDDKTARIDALIAEKERLVLAVRDYEQAELSRILTHGLDAAQSAPTGRPFITEAPIQWRVVAFKRALAGLAQGWSPQCESRPAEAQEWGVLKVGCVNGTSFDANENKALPAALEPDLTCVLQKGDVLVSRANTRELVGMAAMVEDDHPNLLICDKLYKLKLRPDWITAEFSVLLLRSDASRRQIERGASGASSSMQNISQDVIRELLVALPPIAEQAEIVKKAKQIRESCNLLARHCEEHISRLREYRSSLISAAVTGQLDVGTVEGAHRRLLENALPA